MAIKINFKTNIFGINSRFDTFNNNKLINKLKTDDVNNSFLQPIIENMNSLFNFSLARYLRSDLSSSIAELVKTLNLFPI